MCTVKNFSYTLHWNRWGKRQVQIAVSYHWHPHTNTSGSLHSLWHWPFSTCPLPGAGFLQNLQKPNYGHQPQSSCMAPALGFSYSTSFKDLKQQNVTGVNHLSELVSDEETICLCPTALWLPSAEPHYHFCSFCKFSCIQIRVQCFTHTQGRF